MELYLSSYIIDRTNAEANSQSWPDLQGVRILESCPENTGNGSETNDAARRKWHRIRLKRGMQLNRHELPPANFSISRRADGIRIPG